MESPRRDPRAVRPARRTTTTESLAPIALLACIALGACSSVEVERSRVLHDVTVIDGTGSDAKQHQAVIVRGRQIAEIGTVGTVQIPADAEVLDLSGRYVIPGFVDLHVHFPENTAVQEAILGRLLEFGSGSR